MIIPQNEKRQIYNFTLKNNIPVIYLQDDKLDKPAFYFGISVGYFSDPKETAGLAHFLEHLIFMGSDKYPEENYFNEKLAQFNGSTNAYTDTNKTIYYFSCVSSGFKEILDIFFNLIKNPSLSKSSQEREVNAVNSEHEKNILNDNWRFHRLLGLLSKKDHPLYKFGTGNLETLQKKSTIESVRDFFKTYYHSNNFFICLADNKDKQYYKDLLNSNFGQLKSKTDKNIYNLSIPFTNQPKYVYLQSENNSKQIFLSWSLPYIENNMNPIPLINEIMTNLQINSLQKILLNEKLIKSLGFSLDDNSGNYLIITLVINLSYKGIENITKILGIIKQYFIFLSKQNLNELIEEFKKKKEIYFNYGVNNSSFDLLSSIIENMIKTTEPLYYDYDFSNLKQTNIQTILSQLNSIEPNIILLLPEEDFKKTNFKITSKEIEKYYKMEINYLEKFNINNTNYSFEIPNKNKYLETPQLIKLEKKTIEKIKNNYYQFDSSWLTPVNYYSSIIHYPYFKEDLLAINQVIFILNYQIKEYFYDALLLDYDIELIPYPHKNIILINSSGYNSKLNDIIYELFSKIKTFPNLSKYLDLVNQEYKHSLEKYKTSSPIDLISEEFKRQILPNFLTRKELLEKYQNLTIEKFYYLVDKLITNNTFIYQYGNYKEKLISNNTFEINILPNNLNTNLTIFHPNNKETNKAILISYNLGKYNLKMYAMSKLLNELMSEEFFDELRTKKQLGYLVKQYINVINDQIYLIQVIQSQENLDKIEKLINEFNKNYLEILNNLNKEEFENYKENLIIGIKSPFQSMEEEYLFNLKEIITKKYNFDKKNKLANETKNINKSDLIILINSFINKGKVIKIN